MSYTLSAGCIAGCWHSATGHLLFLSPKLSRQDASLAKDGSLVEQTNELLNKTAL